VRIGLLGAGQMGRCHAGILARSGGVEIVGALDADAGRAESLAATHGGRVVPDLERLLELQPDAVFVCTPNTEHADAACALLERGIHVFCEKPMATNLDDARRVVEAAEASSARLQVGFNRRFAPVYAAARRRLEHGFVVDAAHVKINRGELERPRWVGDRSLTGGFLYESTIHLLDLMRYLLGEIDAVRALGRSNRYDETDDYAMLLEFESGLVATFHSCAHAGWMPPCESVELYGDRASLVTEAVDKLRFLPGLDWPVEALDCRTVSFEERWGYEAEDTAFLAALDTESEPAVTAHDGLRAVMLIEAVRQSVLAQGKRVMLDRS